MRDADFRPIGDVRTEVFTTNFPDDVFNANGECIGRFVTEQEPSFEVCEMDYGDRLTDGETGNALWEGVGLERGNRLTLVCNAPGTAHDEYRFMAATRGSDTDYTIYAWSSSVGDEADADDVFESVPANVLTEVTEAVKFVVTGEGSGIDDSAQRDDLREVEGEPAPAGGLAADGLSVSHPGLHFKMGQTVTFTVQLLDEDGDPVGPTPGANNYFEVVEDTYLEVSDAPVEADADGDGNRHPRRWELWFLILSNRLGFITGITGLVYEGDIAPPGKTRSENRSIDPRSLHARDNFVDKIAVFPIAGDLDYTRLRSLVQPDSSGQFEITVSYSDPVRLINDKDALVRVTIIPTSGNTLEPREMTLPMDQAIVDDGVQLPDVRFSDNAAIATTVEANAQHYRIRSLRNRNSISVSVLDQYGGLYRGGDYVVEAIDTDHDGLAPPVGQDDPLPDLDEGIDFPDRYTVSTSGRRSLGYAHTGTSEERQDVTLELMLDVLRIPLMIPSELPEEDDSSTRYVNEAAIGGRGERRRRHGCCECRR